MVAHENPTHRKTWDVHGKDGWYVGPTLEHYRCVRVYLPETHQERICDTVKFIPDKILFPKVTTEDYLKTAVSDIITLLETQTNLNLPNNPGVELNSAIQKTAEILQREVEKPKLKPI